MSPQKLFVCICGLLAATFAAAQECGREVLSYNFDEHSDSQYKPWTEEDIKRAFPDGPARPDFRGEGRIPGLLFARGLERASVGGGHLRLEHPKDCVGTRECGMIFTVRLQEEFDEGTLSYRFRFSKEYGNDGWTLGGKLPGLADEDAVTGCWSKDVTGTGSFVARTMWRLGGQLVSYMYITPTLGSCINGEDWQYTKIAEAEVWYTMYMYIKLNTPGKRDGVHQVWIQDGSATDLVLSRTDVLFRSIAGHGIAKLKFDNFHGGSDERFSPEQDAHILFDDAKVSTGFCVDGVSQQPLRPSTPPAPTLAVQLVTPFDTASILSNLQLPTRLGTPVATTSTLPNTLPSPPPPPTSPTPSVASALPAPLPSTGAVSTIRRNAAGLLMDDGSGSQATTTLESTDTQTPSKGTDATVSASTASETVVVMLGLCIVAFVYLLA